MQGAGGCMVQVDEWCRWVHDTGGYMMQVEVLIGNASCLLWVEVSSPALSILLLAAPESLWSSFSMSAAF